MANTFRILSAADPADRARWADLWEASGVQLPHAHPGFGDRVSPSGSELFAAAYTVGSGGVLYPFHLRPTTLPAYVDIVSPYGYGGPVHWGLDDATVTARDFWALFDQWAAHRGVVSEFIRFSLFDDVLPYPGRSRTRTTNYVVDLGGDADALWAGVASKVRQNVRKGRQLGVTVEIDTTGAMLDAFHPIYLDTMVRRNSDAWYRFDRTFFRSLHEDLAGRFAYVAATIGGEVVSCDLVLRGGDTGYYFLGGTLPTGSACRANEMVKYATMQWLQDLGCARYVLGGGVQAGDSLERYKRGFAPRGAVPFVTGERVLDGAGYAALLDQRARLVGESDPPDPSFFPAYRAPATITESHVFAPVPLPAPSRAGGVHA